jgi:hypothetical protein
VIAFSAKTVDPLHSGVTIQQNDDKIESAPRALTFRKIGQHRWVAGLLLDRFPAKSCMNLQIATVVPGMMWIKRSEIEQGSVIF